MRASLHDGAGRRGCVHDGREATLNPGPGSTASERSEDLIFDIAGRHLAVTQAMEDHVREKLQKVAAHFDGVQAAHVTLAVEGGRHVAEMIVSTNKRGQWVAKATDAQDMYAAIDAATDKVIRQVTRFKERLQDHRRHDRAKAGETRIEESEDLLSDAEADDGQADDMAGDDELEERQQL